MKLTAFLHDLFEHGNLTLPREVHPFPAADVADATVYLQQCYQQDTLEMPGVAPAFQPQVAVWAAAYLYHAIQFVLLRNMEVEVIDSYLQPYTGEYNAEAIYSADLCLRHLPLIFKWSHGLAPSDPLVTRLKATATDWPFSSVGIELGTVQATKELLDDECLRYAYMDRVIQLRDKSRLTGHEEQTILTEILGMHQQVLWPELTWQVLGTI